MIYIASPYSHPDQEVVEARVKATMNFVAGMMKRNYPVFSPVVHCHEIAKLHGLPTDAKFWQRYNTSFIRGAESIIVLQLDGWKESRGVTQEIELAKSLHIQVEYIDADGNWIINWGPQK